jgi:flagellar motor switch protein FliG
MNNLDSSIEGDLMDAIKEIDEALGEEIEDLMFVFDNLADLDDRDLQTLLREVKPETLTLALKGAETRVQEKIFKNMSKRAAELLRDDLEAQGPTRVSEVESSQKEILGVARRLADDGTINLASSNDEML